MLACNCGWKGVNLVPKLNGTAVCPMCSTVFQGIKAENAIVMTDSRGRPVDRNTEDRLMVEGEAGLAILLLALEMAKTQSDQSGQDA